MGRWSDRVENHASTARLASALDAVGDCRSALSEDAAGLALVDRFDVALTAVRNRLRSTDPALIALNTLNSLDQALTQVNEGLQQSIQSKSSNHLEGKLGQLDLALQTAAQFMPLESSDQAPGTVEAVRALRRVAQEQHAATLSEAEGLRQTAASLKSQVAELESKLKGVSEAAEAELASLRERIAEFEKTTNDRIQQKLDQVQDAETKRAEQWTASVESRLSQFTAEQAKRADTFTETSKAQANEFRQAEKQRVAANTKAIAEWKKDLSTVRTQADSDVREIRDDTSKAAADVITSLNERKKEAEELLHVIASTGMSGGYQTVADAHQKAAKLWKGVTFGALFGLIAFAVASAFAAVVPDGGGFPWATVGGRTFTALAFGALATWSGRVASVHLAAERRSRRLQLELASIGPYLAPLPPETQMAVRGALAERWFGRDEQLATKTEAGKSEAVTPSSPNFLSVMDAIIKQVSSK